MKPTLVTCIYDLAKRGHASHRTVDWMFAHSAYVMEMPHQLVVFCDPELAAEVKKRRGDRPTVVFDVPLENLRTHAQRDAIASATLQVNASKAKVTPAYVELMWAKYAMLDDAIARLRRVNVQARLATWPDAPGAIGWIDFAIAHVAKPAPYSIFDSDYSDGIRAHTMRLFDAATVSHHDYWKNVHGHLSGGLVVGEAPAMLWLVDEFFLAAKKALDRGLAVLDEGLLSYIAGTVPSSFRLSYGDYEDILRNHDRIRGGHDHLRWMIDAATYDRQDTADLKRAMHSNGDH